MTDSSQRKFGLRDIPPGIWALGFVSMLMDISSEMIHALLPLYLTTVLGASTLTVGIIEGVAEATASITKVFSGVLSDWLGKRKLLVTVGYGLAAISKPILPLASSIGWIVTARFIDRVGKGIRDAPRDALVADIAPVHLRGASIGLRQSMDTIGAFVGPVVAIALMWWTLNAYKIVFWVAAIPAFMAVAVFVLALREPERRSGLKTARFPLSMTELKRLGSAYWWVVIVAMVFTLARFSEAFLILRANAAGLPVSLVPLVLVVMNVVYALSAYPAGAASDRMNRTTVLTCGFGILVIADLVLAFSSDLVGVAVGVILWGLHLGLTQGLLSTLVADASPVELRGTAYGVFNLVVGLTLLAASIVAGILWDLSGPQATFLAGAGFTFLALVGLAALRRKFGVTEGL